VHVPVADPRREIEAPVRRALARLVVRGIAIVLVVLGAVFLPRLLGVASTDELAAAVPLTMLVGFGAFIRVRNAVRGRPSPELRSRAWLHAREVDPDDAWLALLVTGWVPIGFAVALVLMALPHLSDPRQIHRAAWFALGVPGSAVAWLWAVSGWLDACRDDLARAASDADARLRAYWSGLRG